MSAPAPFTPAEIKAALDMLPANLRPLFAAVAPELEIDTDVRPPVVVCDTGHSLVIATPWKPNKALFGDRMDPTSYCGIVTSGTKANWGQVASMTGRGLETIGAWTLQANDDKSKAVAAGVVGLLVRAGYSVSKAPTMPALFDAIRVQRSKAKMRPAKRRGRKADAVVFDAPTGASASLDLSSIPDAEVAADPRA